MDTTALPMSKTKVRWTALFSFTQKGHYWILVLAVALAACSALVQPAVATFMGKFSDAAAQFGGGLIVSGELREKTTSVVHAFIVLGCCTFVTNAGLFAAWTTFGEMQAKGVRQELFRGLLEKDLEWFEMRESGTSSLLTRLHTQIRELQYGLSQPTAFILSGLIEGFVALGVALYHSWKLALVILAILPLSAVVLFLISRGYQTHIEAQNVHLTHAAKTAHNSISNPSLIKCFSTAAYETARYTTAISKASTHSLRQSRVTAAQMSALGFLMFAMFLIGFYYGGKLVHDGSISPGKVITTIFATFMSVHAFQNVIPHVTFLARAQAAAVALRELIDTVDQGPRSARIADAFSPETCEGDIKLDQTQVSFAYPSQQSKFVSQGCTLHIPAGRTTFLIGKSGSGKSTLSTLLMRFYSASSGAIHIDGHAIEDLNTSWLRNNITFVQQDAILFNETVKKNIMLGHKDPRHVAMEEILESTKLAALEDTLLGLPYGLDTQVGANGSQLSGGQSQRVMIARARIRNTSILILDEATSALDRATTSVVVERIRQWREGLTTIIITHDLTQIKGDDFVYVLEAGLVKSEGLRRELPDLDEQRVEHGETASLESDDGLNTSSKTIVTGNKRQGRKPPNLRWKKEGLDLKPTFEQQLEDMKTGNYMQSPRAFTRASRMTRLFGDSKATRVQSMYATERSAITAVPDLNDTPALPAVPTMPTPKTATIELRPMSLHPTMAARSILQKHAGDEPMPSPRLFEQSPVQFRAKFGGPSFNRVVKEAPTQMSLQAIYTTLWKNMDFIHRIKLVAGISAVCVRATLPSIFAFVMAKNFETFYQQTGWERNTVKWTMVQLVIAIVDATTAFYSQLLLEIAARRWADRLRAEAVKRVLNQPMAWYEQDHNAPSSIASTLDREAEELRALLTRFASLGVNVIIMMTVAMIWSMASCWKLTLVGLSATPVIYGLSKTFDWISTLWAARVNSAADAVGLVFVETFTDIQTVRSFTLEAYFHRKYSVAIKRAYLTGVSRAVYTAALFGLSESTVNFAVAVVIWYAVKLMASYDFSVMPVLTSICLLILSSAQANVIFSIIPQIATAVDSATRLIRLAQLPKNQEDEYNGHNRTVGDDGDVDSSIHFNDVVFAYPTRPLLPVLKGVTFSISPGQCVAIVGRSGSGKTTIGSLLAGLYQPATHSLDTAAPITIFGQDFRSLHLPTVRSLIAVVPQSPFILPGSVWENICYGLEPHTRLTTRHNVNWAATQAAIHDFVVSLPNQYDTIIGEGGMGLSGGQAQRIAIARALVRRPRILILDEATSALDGESAEMIRESLRATTRVEEVGAVGKAAGGSEHAMTVVAITHATEMMRWADKVVVLEDGRVKEEGGFDELVKQRSALWRLLCCS